MLAPGGEKVSRVMINSTLNLHSFQWPAGGRLLCKSDCIEVYDEKNTAFLLICDLSKCFPHEFMVNIVLIRGN